MLAAAGGGRTYVVDAAASHVTIHVGRAGLFKFAGHEHAVVSGGVAGEVVADPESVERSSVRLAFVAAEIKVMDGEDVAADVPKVQATMSGPDVLDVVRFPEIRFRSSAITGRKSGEVWNVTVTGQLELHGARRELSIPLRVTVAADGLVAEGTLSLRQRDYGIEPVSVGGVVKVKDELALSLRIVARATP